MLIKTGVIFTLRKLGAPSVLGAPSASLSIPSKASVIAFRSATAGAIFASAKPITIPISTHSRVWLPKICILKNVESISFTPKLHYMKAILDVVESTVKYHFWCNAFVLSLNNVIKKCFCLLTFLLLNAFLSWKKLRLMVTAWSLIQSMSNCL